SDPLFFFPSRRRHTSSKRDWSSDVCSSDLAGAIVSTADDVARFYRALLVGRLLPPDLMRAMETTVGARSLGPGVRYGLGIAMVRSEERRVGKEWRRGGGAAH